MLEENQPQAKPEAKPAHYDADALQRIPFEVIHKGKRYKVAHLLSAATDELLAEYERRCDVRILQADKSESDGMNAVKSKDQSFVAAVWLWNKLASSVEGYASVDGDDWKEKIKDTHKASAIDDALLACAVDEEPAAEEGELLPLDDDETSVLRLRALYSGYEVATEHILRAPTAEQMKKYQSLQGRGLLVRGTKLGKSERRIPPQSRELGVLYDAMIESTTGYAGRVPLHHKKVVITHHLKAEQEIISKN